jgi:hypothetical protein
MGQLSAIGYQLSAISYQLSAIANLPKAWWILIIYGIVAGLV